MMRLNPRFLTDTFVYQVKDFLRTRHYLRNKPAANHFFDDSVVQTLKEFQHYKKLQIIDGNLNIETLQAIGEEMPPLQLKRLMMLEPQLKHLFNVGGILLTGTKEVQRKSLERFKKMMGGQRMGFINVGLACTIWGNYTNLTTPRNTNFSISKIGDTPNNKIFSQTMESILSSAEIVEFTLAESAKLSNEKTEFTSAQGGAMTFSKSESTTDNVQIFVHPTYASGYAYKAFTTPLYNNEKNPMWSGGGKLEFEEDMIDAHEYGHAWEGIHGDDPNDETGKALSIVMENAVRERYPMPQRRTGHI